jgi:hypothetical protein
MFTKKVSDVGSNSKPSKNKSEYSKATEIENNNTAIQNKLMEIHNELQIELTDHANQLKH